MELFLVGLTTGHVEKFTAQTLEFYKAIRDQNNKEYAGDIFLTLLAKAKENPTAYVMASVKKGTTPSSSDLRRAKDIFETSGILEKNFLSEETLNSQIKEAVDHNQTDKIIELSQVKANIKSCFKAIGWKKSLQEFQEARDVFLKIVLQLEL